MKNILNPYKPFKIKKYNWWFNLYQGNIDIKNIFSVRWKWICDNWSPETEFGINILRFVFPFLYRSLALFSFHLYTWDKRPALYLSIEILFLPSLDFRVGNGETWFWVRSENLYGWKCHRRNSRVTF